MEERKDHNKIESSISAVSVSNFDYSANNFLASMDSIRHLCKLPNEESFDSSEIKRYSSMLTFLREWKYFCYEPKAINFVCEVRPGEVMDDFDGINLPQFSSTTVPKMDNSPNEVKCLDSDFVLHAGGLVWAMDWCPRNASDCSVKCEYLAVAAHPPGSTYHKIGVPFSGRGIIQIWCLLTLEEKVEFCKPTQRRSVKATFNSEGKMVSPTGRPRGRPKGSSKKRRYSCMKDSDGNLESHSDKGPTYDLEGKEELNTRRPRGRPNGSSKKKPCFGLIDFDGKMELSLPCNNPSGLELIPQLNFDLGETALEMPVSVSSIDKEEKLTHPTLPLTELEMPVSVALSGKEEKMAPEPRGRPRNKPTLLVTELEMPVSVALSGKEEKMAPKPRGRPRKKLTVTELEMPVSVALSGNEENLALKPRESHAKEPTRTVGELQVSVSVALHGKEERMAPKPRGRPRKKPTLTIKELVPPSENDVALPVLTDWCGGLESAVPSYGHALVSEELDFPVSADMIRNKVTQEAPKRRGRPRKKLTIPVTEFEMPLSVALSGNEELDISVSADMVRSKVTQEALKRRGRPRKKLTVPVTEFEMPLSVGLSGNEENLALKPRGSPTNKPTRTVTEFQMPVAVTLHGKEEKLAPKPRGRRRKKPTLTVTELVPASETVSTDRCGSLESTVPSYGHALVSEKMEFPVSADMIRNKVTQEFQIPNDAALPKVVICLAHMGRVAWDVKWRPNTNNSDDKCHLGYLAVLLGNGSLEVWDVPHPGMVKMLYTSSHLEGTDPRFIKLKPIFRCSKVMCGERQSIPLTLEWSPSAPHDLILAGCHDGTVALWRFSQQHPSQDTKPLLCFSADSVPIRSLAWAPNESDAGSSNLIVTAGHDGLKFWDIRDPYRPLWECSPVQRIILSIQWLKDPRCLIMSFDDGAIRVLSLWKVANDVPVTSEPLGTLKQLGLHSLPSSHFAIWGCQVSQATGLAAYCTADGSARCFQLTANSVEKDNSRYRECHFPCGSLAIDNRGSLVISRPLPHIPLPNIPFKKIPYGLSDASLFTYTSDMNQARAGLPTSAAISGDDQTPPAKNPTSKPQMNNTKSMSREAHESTVQLEQRIENREDNSKPKIEELPPKIVALHGVRWNMNKGSERWLCYGGAAGIIRCQSISLDAP